MEEGGIAVRFLFVCTCCDMVDGQLDFPPSDEKKADLTGSIHQDIITVDTVCAECQETIWSGAERSFYGQPVIH